MKIRSLAAVALAATLAVALPTGSAWAAHRDDAEQAISQARAVQAQAVGAGIDTADTAPLIEEAQSMLPLRQYTKAIDLATKAIKRYQFALGQTAAIPAGAPGSPASTASAALAERAIAAADAARKQAAAVGGEWRDTFNMIAEARDLAKAGDFAGAIKLADRAKRQGELGQAQALAEKDAGFPDYMLNPK